MIQEFRNHLRNMIKNPEGGTEKTQDSRSQAD